MGIGFPLRREGAKKGLNNARKIVGFNRYPSMPYCPDGACYQVTFIDPMVPRLKTLWELVSFYFYLFFPPV